LLKYKSIKTSLLSPLKPSQLKSFVLGGQLRLVAGLSNEVFHFVRKDGHLKDKKGEKRAAWLCRRPLLPNTTTIAVISTTGKNLKTPRIIANYVKAQVANLRQQRDLTVFGVKLFHFDYRTVHRV